jgi:hypothetical protein
MKRQPVLRSAPGEIILREVGPVIRGVRVGVDDSDRPAIPLSTQHFRTGDPGGARAEDHD